jgi:hypothetical protein
VGTWVSVGYLTGSHIGTIYSYVTRYSYYALIVLAVVIVALIARHLMRRRRPVRGPHPVRRDSKPPHNRWAVRGPAARSKLALCQNA